MDEIRTVRHLRAALTGERRDQFRTLLAQGPASFGLTGGAWTLDRLAAVIERTYGVSCHPSTVSRLLRDLDTRTIAMRRRPDETHFRAWLIDERGLGPAAADDVISRCRRVERVLGVSLSSSVESNDAVERLVQRLESAFPRMVKPGASMANLRSLHTAVRHYADYQWSTRHA